MSVPNQRNIVIRKKPCDKSNLYTINNLEALDEAMGTLQTKGGIKLYIYLAKNQNNYNLNLSRTDFLNWSNIGKNAYIDGFQELVDEGYLVQDIKNKNNYIFYDKSQKTNINIVYE